MGTRAHPQYGLTLGKRRNIFSIIIGGRKKNKHVEIMKKEHAKAIGECQREKWLEFGGQQKTVTDPEDPQGTEQQAFRKCLSRSRE